MMNKNALIGIATLIVVLIISCGFACSEELKVNYKPKEGYVPNAETAIKIAVAVWAPIYGKENIENQKPYQAVLKNGIWHVTGSLNNQTLGGVAEAEISKDNGSIIRVMHGK